MEAVTELAPFIAHGGMVALALVVWWELRSYRRELGREMAAHRQEETESRFVWAKAVGVIERLAQRFDADDAAQKAAGAARVAAQAVAQEIRDEISGVHGVGPDDDTPIPRSKRPRTNPGGKP